MNKKIFSYMAGVLSCLLLLTACGDLKIGEKQAILCPDIFLLSDTDRLIRFDKPAQDTIEKLNANNIILEAKANFGDGKCVLPRNSRELSVSFPVQAIVKRGAGFKAALANDLEQGKKIELFIGVADKTGKAISRNAITFFIDKAIQEAEEKRRNDFLTVITRKPNDKENEKRRLDIAPVLLEELVKVKILLSEDDYIKDYKIFVGFVLTPSELKVNREGYLPQF